MEPTPYAQSDPAPPGAIFAADGLLDALPWGVLVVDEQHLVRRVNQQAARWCGILPEALLGRPLAEAALPPAVRATLLHLLAPGAAPREVLLPQSEQWIALSATRQPDGWVIYGQDMTSQKRREQQYLALAENTPDVLTRWDSDLRLCYANAAFAAKAGVPLRELLGRTNREMGQPEDIAGPYMAALQRVFDTGRPQEHFNDFPTPHGTVHYYSRIAPELRDGQVETVLSIARDISELKQTQAETLRLKDELAQQAADKYHTLFESIDEGFCTIEVLFDEAGNALDYLFLEANPAFGRQTGLANVVGRTMRELAPAHEAFWFDTYGRIALTGEARRFEHEAAALGKFYDVYAFRIGAPAENRVAILFNDMLARKRAQEALRKSEEQFRLFVTASSDILYRMDAGWQHMLHLNGKRLLADTTAPSPTWLETYIPPADQPAVAAAIRAAIAGPHFFELEHRVFRADGSVGWTFSRAVPVLNARGELVEWFGTATDITARKQAEEALYASEQRQRALIENLPGAAVFVVDRALRYQLAEGEALRPVGYEPAHFLGRTVREMAPPGQWPTSQALYEGALAGRAFAHEHEQSGHTFLTRGVPLSGPAGEVAAVLAVSYDITARKQAEEALRASEAKYRTLFETMDQGFGIGEVLPAAAPAGSMDFRWLEVNPQYERLTGVARADVLSGQTMRQLLPAMEETWFAHYGQVAATGEPVRFEQYSSALDRWFDVYAFPLGKPAQRRVAVLFSNTTERKRTAEALRHAEERHRGQLEQQVAERTQELQESRDLLHAIAESQAAYISAFKALRDERGRIVDLEYIFVNSITEQLDGRHPMVGRRFLEVFPELKDSGYLDSYRRVIETGVGEDRELTYTDNQLAGWFRSNATKLDDGVLVIGEDITARKQAEQERIRNLHLLEQAEAVAGLGSWDYDLLSQQFLWSDGMYQLFGLPLGQPVSPDIYLQFVVAEDRPRAEELVRRLQTGNANFEETLRLRVGEQVKTVRIKAVVLYNEQGEPLRVLGVDLDISQLQRLEADNLRLRLTQQQALFEAVQAAQETERKRMAESLHNGIGQILYATKLRLDRLHAPLLGTDPSLLAARREADQLLSEAIRQTRALSHELVPMMLEEFGLAAALQDIGSKMSTPQLRLRSQVQLDEAAAALAPPLQMALYRMAQELAQNIAKHARGATEASLELETMPGWVLLRAEDDGAGFAQAPAESPGLGLRSIRDRVALLGGQLQTGSAPTGGAYVRIRIPLPASPTP